MARKYEHKVYEKRFRETLKRTKGIPTDQEKLSFMDTFGVETPDMLKRSDYVRRADKANKTKLRKAQEELDEILRQEANRPPLNFSTSFGKPLTDEEIQVLHRKQELQKKLGVA